MIKHDNEKILLIIIDLMEVLPNSSLFRNPQFLSVEGGYIYFIMEKQGKYRNGDKVLVRVPIDTPNSGRKFKYLDGDNWISLYGMDIDDC